MMREHKILLYICSNFLFIRSNILFLQQQPLKQLQEVSLLCIILFVSKKYLNLQQVLKLQHQLSKIEATFKISV